MAGQNSYDQANSQDRLATYCQNTDINIIPLAFMDGINPPVVNFASAGNNCTTLASGLLQCPQIEYVLFSVSYILCRRTLMTNF